MTFPLSFQPPLRQACILALIAGAINVFSFAPFGWWWLQFLTLALLFRLTLQAPSVKRALLLGWVFGFGWLACSIYWLYISMHDYGGMPAPMAALAVALLAATLGIFSGIACGFATWFARRLRARESVTLLLVLPAAWALTEWLRGWIFSGFPWTVS